MGWPDPCVLPHMTSQRPAKTGACNRASKRFCTPRHARTILGGLVKNLFHRNELQGSISYLPFSGLGTRMKPSKPTNANSRLSKTQIATSPMASVKLSGASSKKTTSCKGCLLVACKSWSIPCHRWSILFLQRVHQFLWEPVRFHRMALCWTNLHCLPKQASFRSLKIAVCSSILRGVWCLWSQAKHEGRRVHFLGHQFTLRLHAFTKASSYCCFQSFFSSRRRG